MPHARKHSRTQERRYNRINDANELSEVAVLIPHFFHDIPRRILPSFEVERPRNAIEPYPTFIQNEEFLVGFAKKP